MKKHAYKYRFVSLCMALTMALSCTSGYATVFADEVDTNEITSEETVIVDENTDTVVEDEPTTNEVEETITEDETAEEVTETVTEPTEDIIAAPEVIEDVAVPMTMTVNEVETQEVDVQLQDGEVIIPDGADESTVKEILFDALVVNKEDFSAQDLEWEYYCEGKSSTGLAKNDAWGSVNGFTSEKKVMFIPTTFTHPALSDNEDGSYKIRIEGTTDEVTVTKYNKEPSNIVVKGGEYSVSLYVNDYNSSEYNYDRLREDIFNAVVDVENSNPSDLTVDDITFEHKGTFSWYPLEGNSDDFTGLTQLKPEQDKKIRLTLPETDDRKGSQVEVTVDVNEFERAASSVVLKANSSFTYNKDVEAMKTEIFNNVIDWENSTLPSKDSVSIDMFNFEYYATAKILGSDQLIKNDWAPLEGGFVNFLEYPVIGAGEYKIKVTFNGNSTHTNSSAETDIAISKAKVSVKVKTTNKYADEKLPDDFVTLSVDDKFDIYTVYGGVTSSLAPTAYLQISGIEDSKFIEIIDKLLAFIGEETLTEKMQDGITLGELNDIVSKLVNAANTIPFFADFVKSQGIDLDALVKLTEVIGKLPDSTNDIKIALGEPDMAGLYTVFAVANNPNYETGVGMGMLLVKMRMSGTKLIYNQDIPSKITVEQAKTYDFTADVWHDGVRKTAEDGAKVKYLYSGLTSKWRLYSSTTTPPTEPGKYTQTIVTLGGNYQAAPVTRAFQIVK
ncbi:hypothetical protein B5E58_06140 [Tyzzerella sp. An114]|uniref:hypothetical protein n=1 Tax=Tyzzerella sp. An114 TaxID=1965545 RepID=UPI000B43365F|nr:hypothetical protein [Tyzzerella sp. An114]OUQ58760.1 hypothetical protein B5E58_06140 [Tyzzerella sp. An114]